MHSFEGQFDIFSLSEVCTIEKMQLYITFYNSNGLTWLAETSQEELTGKTETGKNTTPTDAIRNIS